MRDTQGGTPAPCSLTGSLCGCPILYGFWGRYRQLSNCQRPSMNVQVRGFIALAGAFGVVVDARLDAVLTRSVPHRATAGHCLSHSSGRIVYRLVFPDNDDEPSSRFERHILGFVPCDSPGDLVGPEVGVLPCWPVVLGAPEPEARSRRFPFADYWLYRLTNRSKSIDCGCDTCPSGDPLHRCGRGNDRLPNLWLGKANGDRYSGDGPEHRRDMGEL